MRKNNSEIVGELKNISEDAINRFGNFTPEQINRRPSATGWSVGQCFEHLIKSNELFFGELDIIAAGTRKNSLYERFSPLSGFFGRLLISSLKKDERKFKAPTSLIIPPSEIDPNIIEIFAAHQAELIGKIKATETADWRKTKVTSPFLKAATYTLADAYRIIIEHEKRHVRQAARVLAEINFPK